MFDLVGIELPCMDLNVNVDNLPDPDGTSLINQLSWQGGGKVSSGIVAAARLGADCAIIGAVGNDNYGRFIQSDFQRHTVNTEHLRIEAGKSTPLSIVLSAKTTKSRSFMFRKGNANLPCLTKDDLDMVKRSKYLFVSMLRDEILHAVHVARENGVGIIIDADSYSDTLRESIPLIDIFIGSEYVHDAFFNDDHSDYALRSHCESLMKQGPRIVVFTLGKDGCAGVSKDGFFRIPAFNVPVVDTVGAGDVFHGAFMAALIKGYAPEECARYASGASNIKITRIGGRAGIPTWEVLERFLKDGYIDYTEINERVKFYEKGLEHV